MKMKVAPNEIESFLKFCTGRKPEELLKHPVMWKEINEREKDTFKYAAENDSDVPIDFPQYIRTTEKSIEEISELNETRLNGIAAEVKVKDFTNDLLV